MNLELLVRPVESGTEGQIVRILQTSKVGFDVVLGAIGKNDLLIGPVGSVGEQQGLAQQGRAEMLIGLIAKAERESRQASTIR